MLLSFNEKRANNSLDYTGHKPANSVSAVLRSSTLPWYHGMMV